MNEDKKKRKKIFKEREPHLKKKRRLSSSSDSSLSSVSQYSSVVCKDEDEIDRKNIPSFATSSEESEEEYKHKEAKKKKKKEKIEKHKKDKKKKKDGKHKKKKEKKKKDNKRSIKEKSTSKDAAMTVLESNSAEVPVKPASKRSMAPMTREEYEKQQSVIRRVTDPETGRQRLVKGDGEVLEECVSYTRHKEINKQATRGDGTSFQRSLGLN